METDENLQMQRELAESWDISDDNLTWTFQLRDHVTFHSGSDFTSADVTYSYSRMIDEEPRSAPAPSPWRSASGDHIALAANPDYWGGHR